ncbi:hypothetical protein F4861DRAFT_239071 [Xylaria intraflava]|nr:hypothetical protein F4861DRAFT_239071 [Xylaria intraflava]
MLCYAMLCSALCFLLSALLPRPAWSMLISCSVAAFSSLRALTKKEQGLLPMGYRYRPCPLRLTAHYFLHFSSWQRKVE